MKKNIKLFKFELIYFYLPFLILFILSIFYFKKQPQTQVRIVFFGILIYLFSSLIYHFKDKTLTLEVIIEYILIALLSIVVISGFFI